MKIKEKVLKQFKYKGTQLPFGDVARDIAVRFNEELDGAIDLTIKYKDEEFNNVPRCFKCKNCNPNIERERKRTLVEVGKISKKLRFKDQDFEGGHIRRYLIDEEELKKELGINQDAKGRK